MRKLLTGLLLMSTVAAHAQSSDEDDGTPVIYSGALDTNIAGAMAFNNTLAREAGGLSLAFVDSTVRGTVLSVYKSNGPEGLRVQYKYRYTTDGEGPNAVKKLVINYIKISATENTMTRVYNYIFHATIQPNQLLAASSNGTPAKYRGQNCMYVFNEADYRPGYWELTFVK
jgi:hypothetical protein